MRALPLRARPLARPPPQTCLRPVAAVPPPAARRTPSPPPLPDGLKPRPWTGSPKEAAALAAVLQRTARAPGGPVDEDTAVWVSLWSKKRGSVLPLC